MMKKFSLELKNKIYIKCLTLFIFILLFIPTSIFSSEIEDNVISNDVHSNSKIDNVNNNTDLMPLAARYNESVAVTGDSYAGLLCDFAIKNEIKTERFVYPGQTILQNKPLMLDAAKSKHPVLIISVGVNDHMKCTPPYIFEEAIRDVIYDALNNKKMIILHSFVDYPSSKTIKTNYKISYYDNALKRIADDFDIVYYIDMNKYAMGEYCLPDNIHYDKGFYDILFARIADLVCTIDF